ncbi:MAG TPA: RNA polymerase sigma factor, partial [Gemmataceae bacterium]|nr:RNA polymerase sigma factor [Gemmataceae bacterium]
MSDAELVRQALAGRAEAYAELVRRWTPRVLALCHARVRRADVAEDLAQEALLRGYRSLASLSQPERFGAWLHGIALRACLDWLKARERTTVPFSALGNGRDPDGFLHPRAGSEPALDRDDERRRLLAEVEALPEEYRTVILLYYYEKVTYRELAEALGVSTATVNARLTKARAL